jgi:hypothetical protein
MINLTSYSSLMNSQMFPPLIIPGDPEHSSLYTTCLKGAMPKNDSRLSASALSALYTWIKNGAVENEETPIPHPSATPTGEPGGDDSVPNTPTQGGFSKNEPCDLNRLGVEPGLNACSTEPE